MKNKFTEWLKDLLIYVVGFSVYGTLIVGLAAHEAGVSSILQIMSYFLIIAVFGNTIMFFIWSYIFREKKEVL